MYYQTHPLYDNAKQLFLPQNFSSVWSMRNNIFLNLVPNISCFWNGGTGNALPPPSLYDKKNPYISVRVSKVGELLVLNFVPRTIQSYFHYVGYFRCHYFNLLLLNLFFTFSNWWDKTLKQMFFYCLTFKVKFNFWF